jgi:hypothetical protein
MVGAKNARFTKEGISRSSAGPVLKKIWNLAKAMNKDRYFVDVETEAIVDDHRFIVENTRIPMLDIVNHPKDRTFGYHWHTHQDDLEVIDPTTLQAVGQVILAVVYNESNKQF